MKSIKTFEKYNRKLSYDDLEEEKSYMISKGDAMIWNRHGNKCTGFYLRQKPFEVMYIHDDRIVINYDNEIFSIKDDYDLEFIEL